MTCDVRAVARLKWPTPPRVGLMHTSTRVRPWDFAAGDLLVRAAGGVSTDYRGNEGIVPLFADRHLASIARIAADACSAQGHGSIGTVHQPSRWAGRPRHHADVARPARGCRSGRHSASSVAGLDRYRSRVGVIRVGALPAVAARAALLTRSVPSDGNLANWSSSEWRYFCSGRCGRTSWCSIR